MSKIQLPPVFISPNMKLSQHDTDHGKGLNDAVLARNEKYITPDGKKALQLFSQESNLMN